MGPGPRDRTDITLPGPPADPEAMRNAYGGAPLDDATLAFVVDPVRNVPDTINHYFQPVHWSAAASVPVTYAVNEQDRPIPAPLQDEMIGRLPRAAARRSAADRSPGGRDGTRRVRGDPRRDRADRRGPSRMTERPLEVHPIGVVESPLTDRSSAPKQGHEGAPDAWLVIHADVQAGLEGLHVGDRVIVLTWLDRADRDVLRVRPRDDRTRPEQGVFGTRSPTGPTRSACTRSRSSRSNATACACATSKRSTARRSSTSSRCWAANSTATIDRHRPAAADRTVQSFLCAATSKPACTAVPSLPEPSWGVNVISIFL